MTADSATLTLDDGRNSPVRFSVENLRRAEIFTLIEPQLRMTGMYRYMADAGIFIECLTGLKMPVSPEGDNIALERGYLSVRREPGEPVLVSLEGRIARRMPVEGAGPVPMLVPVKFESARPGDTCESR